MVIGQLFQDDINRKINGVVKVDQDATDVLFRNWTSMLLPEI